MVLRGDITPQEDVHQYLKIFLTSVRKKVGERLGDAADSYRIEDKDAAQYPTKHRAVFTTNNSPALNVNSTRRLKNSRYRALDGEY